MSAENQFHNAMGDTPSASPAPAPASSEQRHYPAKPDKVYFYGTCVVDLLAPQAGIDAIELIESQGVEVIFVQQQSCCGQPAYTSGYTEQALDVARSQLKLFDQPWPLVVLSGSCGGMIRHHYPSLFKAQPESQKAFQLAERTFEFSEFLLHVLNIRLADSGAPERVVLHTSCTARREMNTHLSGRALLDQLSAVEVAQQDHEAECCGFGGAFSVRHPQISGAMVEDKARSLENTEAAQLVSADYGCLMNINGALEAKRSRLQGIHLASYLKQRCGGQL
ncbi:(Fe-S)-binding protein [Aestuariirhabdus sp. Z084]|uniref:(Fe-S)-binding protein n=1 Tax=Aestuariirhabdus haliotis TaxID=2918751 RepID=UPI00201B393D|nr:(Fe-S)-binding protein [Aestuariirhabdus haliotis]MCL6416430.1 (Fe-S)-binding protein [Aestuariirhabdus haliotis]MCL6420404.1 (Fe-S)-binding protein [Aestuariirhabdus haliotis]